MPLITTFSSLSDRALGGFGSIGIHIRGILGITDTVNYEFNGMVCDSQQNYTISYTPTAGGTWVDRYSPTGYKVYTKSISDFTGKVGAVDSTGNVYLAGAKSGSGMIVKLDVDGNIVWQYSYSPTTNLTLVDYLGSMYAYDVDNVYFNLDESGGMGLYRDGTVLDITYGKTVYSDGTYYSYGIDYIPDGFGGYLTEPARATISNAGALTSYYYTPNASIIFLPGPISVNMSDLAMTRVAGSYGLVRYNLRRTSDNTIAQYALSIATMTTRQFTIASSNEITNYDITTDSSGNIYVTYCILTTTYLYKFNSTGTTVTWARTITGAPTVSGSDIPTLTVSEDNAEVCIKYPDFVMSFPTSGLIPGTGTYTIGSYTVTYASTTPTTNSGYNWVNNVWTSGIVPVNFGGQLTETSSVSNQTSPNTIVVIGS